MKTIPLFPLPLVLFPGGKLPLRIFEPRYLDLVRRSLGEDKGFGIVMLEGQELESTGDQVLSQLVSRVGTFVKIVDFDQLANGLLTIMVEGEETFRIAEISVQEDRLVIADIKFLVQEQEQPVPADKSYLVDLLETLAAHQGIKNLGISIDYNDAREVSWRLTEFLPLANTEKQRLLELSDSSMRLEELAVLVQRLQH